MHSIETSGTRKPCLTLLFRIHSPEEYEALHYWRAAFGPATDIEPVNETVFALHIWPGCRCEPDQGEGV
ncbi:MAG: hypothetical protein M3315_04805 [Actinomycetota bacterium]|nr:hypothetical protein [Actinomycetota bacterium]